VANDSVSGGELFDRITAPGRDSLPELESRSIVHQILSAVAYLHRHDIVHRDLKPENILTSGDAEKIVVKIADFGLANLLQNDRTKVMKTQCGSFPYVAPEVLRSAGYGKEVDMWAIGVISKCFLFVQLTFF
jgi:calcium/calmodulin-dependent protein kinase I